MKTAILIGWLTLLQLTALQPPLRSVPSAVPLVETLSSYSTSFHSGQEQRNHNIRLAAAILNGKEIRPGAIFSFNQTIGERSEQAGFLKAPYLEFGEKLDVEGGGICLVSSIVYNAALVAGMEILERYPHSRQIPYLPAGQDATVDFGHKDLRFKNSLSQTVRIETVVAGDRLIVRLTGSTPPPYQVRLHTDRSLEPDGMLRVIAYRDYLRNGRTYRQEILSDDLYPAPGISVSSGTPLEGGVLMPQ